MRCLRAFAASLLTVGLVPALTAWAEPAPTPAPLQSDSAPRAIWVTRWDFRTPEDVRRIMADCASIQTTDVIWQARGQADAFYKSDLEPWGLELFRDLPPGTTEPTFDPLATAVAEAHARGMRLHAWVNAMPLWKGPKPPANPRHLFNAKPEWRLHDAAGTPQALNDHYVIVNPVLDEVQDHIVAVCKDIVTRYPVDGIHLDYIRFVSEKMDPKAIVPADAASLALFKTATGHDSIATADEIAAYQDWKRQRITDLVARIKKDAVDSRPGCILTAAVWQSPDTGLNENLQDGAAWLRDGLVERVFPMIYTEKDDRYAANLTAWISAVHGRLVTPGIGVYKHTPGQTAEQIIKGGELGADGYALFSYESFFETVNPDQSKKPDMIKLRADRLAAYKDWQLRQPVLRPANASEAGAALGTPRP